MEESSGVNSSSQAMVSITGSATPSPLMQLLMAESIEPGSQPGYELAKIIYTDHPLGSKMAEAPINMALSQEREITIEGGPEEELRDAFTKEWKRQGVVGADVLIHNTMKTSRIYGIGSIVVGCRGKATDVPMSDEDLRYGDLYYNIMDPLNSAGSLVLNQDPNAPDFQKPNALRVGNVTYHPANSVIVMNEQPIYISWTNSAFGFVGRSVYQRALYPLKSFVQTMITDDMIAVKAGALIYKAQSPGSMVDRLTQAFYRAKATLIKLARVGNIVTIGETESVESIDLKNLHEPFHLAREDILKNIATAANMPASMINNETLAEGFGEGSEDAKQIARYIDRVRIEMAPLYVFFDDIVQRRAWTPELYDTLAEKYEEVASMDYETAFYRWRNSFKAVWPNLLVEPDSERAKVDEAVMTATVGLLEVILPAMDPVNKATAIAWAADVMNGRKLLVSTPLILDEQLIAEYEPPTAQPQPEMETLRP
ncbi:MAG: anti-CBASS protein Acb1 family protein [Acidobacteriaceae bacterium]